MTHFGKLVFVDLETTGANMAQDRITEIGMIEVDEDGVATRWSTLVNPGRAITPFIEQLTGISNDMVRDAPTFDQVSKDVHARLQDGLFIAHNARFDYGFLHHAYGRTEQRLQTDALCTVKLSRALFPEEKKHNLDILIERHALVPQARHRALADADLLLQLWGKLKAKFDADHFAATVTRLRHRPNIAPSPTETVDMAQSRAFQPGQA